MPPFTQSSLTQSLWYRGSEAVAWVGRFFLLLCFALAALSSPASASTSASTSFTDGTGASIEGLHCPEEDKKSCRAYWERRTVGEKRLILAARPPERYLVLVCLFLGYEDNSPALISCIKEKITNFRALRFCQQAGHELLSAAAAACETTWRANNVVTVPRAP